MRTPTTTNISEPQCRVVKLTIKTGKKVTLHENVGLTEARIIVRNTKTTQSSIVYYKIKK